jgi:nucleoside-diphosphate-sugar epimerase
MKIGVSGASGHLGMAVVSELLQRAAGHEVVAISRTPETIAVPAQARFGDYDLRDRINWLRTRPLPTPTRAQLLAAGPAHPEDPDVQCGRRDDDPLDLI